MNIQELLKIAGEQGKVVIVGEDGKVQGVYLNYTEYQKLSGSAVPIMSAEQMHFNREVERVNREILQAQLEEVIAPQPEIKDDDYIDPAVATAITQLLDQSNSLVTEAVSEVQADAQQLKNNSNTNSLNSLLSQRAETLFGNYPGPSAPAPKVQTSPNDLRAEVMDPNFDYGDEGGGNNFDEPHDDETIKPNFEDI